VETREQSNVKDEGVALLVQEGGRAEGAAGVVIQATIAWTSTVY
jgi:hypothetical protein